MSEFKVSSGPVSSEQALAFAAELETVIGEIGNGKRKAGRIPMEPMIALIQFARDTAQLSAQSVSAVQPVAVAKVGKGPVASFCRLTDAGRAAAGNHKVEG